MSVEAAIKQWGSWQVGVMKGAGVVFDSHHHRVKTDTISDAIEKLCVKIDRLEREISFLTRSNSQNDAG